MRHLWTVVSYPKRNSWCSDAHREVEEVMWNWEKGHNVTTSRGDLNPSGPWNWTRQRKTILGTSLWGKVWSQKLVLLHKSNTQILALFLHISNKQSKTGIRKNSSVIIIWRNNKFRDKFKEKQNIYTENYKMPLREIQQSQAKWGDLMRWGSRPQWEQIWAGLPKLLVNQSCSFISYWWRYVDLYWNVFQIRTRQKQLCKYKRKLQDSCQATRVVRHREQSSLCAIGIQKIKSWGDWRNTSWVKSIYCLSRGS